MTSSLMCPGMVTRAAHFVNNMMSQGSILIDPTGVVSLRCLEAA